MTERIIPHSGRMNQGVRNQESGIRDQGSGIRDQGSGIRDQGSEEITGGFAAAEMLGRGVFFLTRRSAPLTFLIPDT
ncbi:MAG: hypothetical protein LBI62_04245 [Candidatus Accumulibacter sp.]|jgi:hypothetical protein|nr:hypothetical protein [Accumulibacter sp.]